MSGGPVNPLDPVGGALESRFLRSRRSFAETEARSVRWLLPGVIPRRTSTVVAGVGGLGKSTWLLALAGQTTKGEINGEPASSVIVVSYEDTIAEILRPRAEAVGADLDRLFEIVVPAEAGGAVLLPRDLETLDEQIAATGARLVIVDPVLAAIDVALDAHKDQHVRIVLAQLAALAENRDCAIVLVLHLNKAPTKDAYLRISSSTGFYNAARSVVLVVPDPEEPEHHRLMAQVKSNWSRRSAVQRHVIKEIVLPSVDPETGQNIITSKMEFVEVAEGVDRDTLLGAEREGAGGERVSQAVVWLQGKLADGDWHDSAGLKNLAAAAGISERTTKRAALEELEVEHERRGFPSSTFWRLPQSGQPLSPTFGPTEEDEEKPHNQAESEQTEKTVGPVGPSNRAHRAPARLGDDSEREIDLRTATFADFVSLLPEEPLPPEGPTTVPRPCRCPSPVVEIGEDGDRVCFRCGRPLEPQLTLEDYRAQEAEQRERDRQLGLEEGE